jgi:hypothetical protein
MVLTSPLCDWTTAVSAGRLGREGGRSPGPALGGGGTEEEGDPGGPGGRRVPGRQSRDSS